MAKKFLEKFAAAQPKPAATTAEPAQNPEIEAMRSVMETGMQFLAGKYKMTTGREMQTGANRVEVEPQTGELVMRFKLGD